MKFTNLPQKAQRSQGLQKPKFMLYQQIYKDFVEQLNNGKDNDHLLAIHQGMCEITYEDFCKYIFHNYTTAFPTLKLTKIGFVILSKMYQCWKFELKNTDLSLFSSGKITIFLHKKIKVPYYYDSRQFVVFGSEPALELQMASGDIELWEQMFS